MDTSTKIFNKEQLSQFGSSADKIYLALNGHVFDVTKGKDFYGEGGPYHMFAGRDATFGLGSMSLTVDSECRKLSEDEMEIAKDWEKRFREKYPIIGQYCINTNVINTNAID